MFARTLLLIAVAVSVRAASVPDTVQSAALAQTKEKIVYDGRYVRIPYPNGDVPAGTGVCTDVVIRAYRKAGYDLQKLVHEDMKKEFSAYPKKWGKREPDSNIDHRRVPNLMTFFKRAGAEKPITKSAVDYEPGDLVAYDLGGGVTHIGVAVAGPDHGIWIVHNIGRGPQLEDALFGWKIIGHYRWSPPLISARAELH